MPSQSILCPVVQACSTMAEEGSHSADRNINEDLIAENSDWNMTDSYIAETTKISPSLFLPLEPCGKNLPLMKIFRYTVFPN